MNSKDFRKSVFAGLMARLASLGFEQRTHEVLTLPITEEVVGWLGFNKPLGKEPGLMEVNPVVGIRNRRVERMVAELLGVPFNENTPPTLAANIGYLQPEGKYLPFHFRDPITADAVADTLLETVKTQGLPFIQANTDLATLLQSLLTAPFAKAEQVAFRIPVAHHLLGQRVEAEQFLTRKLEELGTRPDPSSQRFRLFAAKFRDLISSPTGEARETEGDR